MKRFKKILYINTFFIFIIIYLSSRNYEKPTLSDLRCKIAYLERMVNNPLYSQASPIDNGIENPEWNLFSLSFSVYGFTNIAMQDISFKNEAALYIDKAIQKVLTDSIYRFYSNTNPISPSVEYLNLILA